MIPIKMPRPGDGAERSRVDELHLRPQVETGRANVGAQRATSTATYLDGRLVRCVARRRGRHVVGWAIARAAVLAIVNVIALHDVPTAIAVWAALTIVHCEVNS